MIDRIGCADRIKNKMTSLLVPDRDLEGLFRFVFKNYNIGSIVLRALNKFIESGKLARHGKGATTKYRCMTN